MVLGDMAVHPGGSSPPAHDRPDVDRLLAGYRGGLAQEALFDLRPPALHGPTVGYDEFLDETGTVRPAWGELADTVGDRGRAGMGRLGAAVRQLVDNDDITYTGVDPTRQSTVDVRGESRPWRLDPLPLVVSAADWDVLESGLVQRSRILNAVLADLYGGRRSLVEGVLPPELLFAHPGYVRAANGIEVPGHHQLFMHACDVSRFGSGGFAVNADWTQAPSGAGYALADRRVLAQALPDLYEKVGPRPVTPFAHALRLALIDAAPDGVQDPVVVVLSPGIYSETSFDHAYLATVLGFPLVESADLVVRDGTLWMRSLGTLKRVDVVFRRVDAAYTDPLDLRADSRLGVAGLVEAQRRGTVTVVNTVGSGVLESAGLQRFLPELATRLLGEAPLLPSAPSYWGGIDSERSHLLANLSSLLIRPTIGGQTLVGPTLSSERLSELSACIEAMPWQWVGQELPEFSWAPTSFASELSAGAVGLRMFTVAQRGGYAPMLGGLGYVLAQGPSAYTLKSIATKDVWVQPTDRSRTETVSPHVAESPAKAGAGTVAVSSPRVLSDLFWMGRYGERAENMARLLIAARRRYYEFRHRQEISESQCVPVLMAALGRITGTDPGPADHAETIAIAPSTLWSLTMDRDRPGSLVHSVDRLALAARAVRDQLSSDTWAVLAGVERSLAHNAEPPDSLATGDAVLEAAQSQTLIGMVTLAGVASESMVHDVGWTMMDIGKRIERGLGLTALLDATLTTVLVPAAERTVIESAMLATESAVIYRRRTAGQVSVSALAELMLFDATNPRSLVYQLERLRSDLDDLPGSNGSSRLVRMVAEISTLVRRSNPDDLESMNTGGHRDELAELLTAVHSSLRELADVVTATQLALPGGIQPLWGGDERRTVP